MKLLIGRSLDRYDHRLVERHTVRPGDLAPDHADLGSSDLLLALVDICDLLAKVEASITVRIFINMWLSWLNVLGGVGVVNTLDLDQARLGVGGVSATLVA